MFIKLHLVSGKSPVSLNLDHVVKIAPAADGEGAVVHLDQDYETVYVSESYEDVNLALDDLFGECFASNG
jgi:hypothetical protein